jgi:acetylglutamate kinase
MAVESRFVDGMRVTDPETMVVVEMVLSGTTNAEIVALINDQGGRAVGLSGKDDRLIVAEKLLGRAKGGGAPVDLGLVGRPVEVNPAVLEALDEFIPVIAPIGVGRGGETYNINADLVAGAVAAALTAEKMIMLTDVPGVLDREGGLISSLTATQARELIAAGVIAGGMIPKVDCCLEALAGGVAKTHIIDGRLPHAVLLEIFTRTGIGTEIVRD